ncbi:MAG: ABC transporter ATP-binding protein [bacterium]
MIQTSGLTKLYMRSGKTVHAIDGITMQIESGDFAVVQGPSGSGKSTLLLILGGMLKPTSGTVLFQDKDLYAFSRTQRNRFRKHSVGFIFQKFHLMPYLTVYDNIRLPLAIRNKNRDAEQRIQSLTHRLGIADRLTHRPAELSVGEQQRVAMARTLAGEPDLILADEPTGNLDRGNSTILAECLLEEHRQGRTIILATHDETLLEIGSVKFYLESGRLGNQ